MSHRFVKLSMALLLCSMVVQAPRAFADHFSYEVTITNLTRGQSFTPILFVTHKRGLHLFEPGAPASDALAALAESGDTGPLTQVVEASGKAADVLTADGLLDPGMSRTVMIKASKRARFMSMAAMLIPTNDAFVAVNAIPLPGYGHGLRTYAVAYDAGSEPNDELCANIPGPVCGGAGLSPEAGGEGFVHVHSGIHGNGDDINSLNAAERDWRNPVAMIRIKRIKAQGN